MDALQRRIRDRKIVQWGLAYLAGAWVLLQGFDILGNQFGIPGWILRAATVILAAGFIAALIVAWYHGEKGAQALNGVELMMLTTLTIGTASILWLIRSEDPDAALQTKSAVPVVLDTTGGPSIAVLAFDDLSADSSAGRLADAIHDQILTHLAQVPGLNPVARTSVVALRNSNLTGRQLADTLRVRYLLEGSVQRFQNRVKVITQLIDPRRNDAHLSADNREFELSDPFALQEEVADWVMENLLRTLPGVSPSTNQHVQPKDSAAYEAYLTGRQHENERTRDGLSDVIGAFEESIQLDPTFAPAYAALALAYGRWGVYGHPGPNGEYEAYGRALALADRAVELDPKLGDAHTTRAYLMAKAFAPASQVSESFNLAIEQLPSSSDLHILYASFLTREGRFDQALRESEYAIRLDPVGPGRDAGFAWNALAAGKPDIALRSAVRANRLEPQLVTPRIARAFALVMLNRAQECSSIDLGAYAAVRAICLHAAGRAAEARALIDSVQARAMSGPPAAYLASYHAYTGDVGRTLKALEQSFARTPHGLDFRVIASGIFAPVRNDPQFKRGYERLQQEVWQRSERARQSAARQLH